MFLKFGLVPGLAALASCARLMDIPADLHTSDDFCRRADSVIVHLEVICSFPSAEKVQQGDTLHASLYICIPDQGKDTLAVFSTRRKASFEEGSVVNIIECEQYPPGTVFRVRVNNRWKERFRNLPQVYADIAVLDF